MAWNLSGGKTVPGVMLWSAPRSLSTVFERAIIALDDSDVYNEMYTAAFLFGKRRVCLKKIPPLAPTLSHAKVTRKLRKAVKNKKAPRVVFAKDFAFAVKGHFEDIPEEFLHTFLIRDPVKVFTSLKPRLESSRCSKMFVGTSILGCIPAEGYTIKELYDLFKYAEHKTRKTPIVIDADDLVSDPKGMLKQYCSATGIPFDEKMLHWKPAKVSDMRWHCPRVLKFSNWCMGWYDSALASSGFRKPTPKNIDLNDLSPEVKEALEFTIPYYQAMYKVRLRPKDGDEVCTDHSDHVSSG